MRLKIDNGDLKELVDFIGESVDKVKIHFLSPNYDPYAEEENLFFDPDKDLDSMSEKEKKRYQNKPEFPEELKGGGIWFDQMDEGKISFIGGAIPSSSMASLELNHPRTTIALKCGRVSDVLSNNDDDMVEVRLKDDNRLVFDSDDLHYVYSPPQASTVESGVRPNLDYNVEFRCTASDFAGALSATGMVSSHMTIEVVEVDGVHEVRGSARGDSDETYKEITTATQVENEVSSKFSANYLWNFIKPTASDKTIDVEMMNGEEIGAPNENFPIQMTTDIMNEGYITYMSAPRNEGS